MDVLTLSIVNAFIALTFTALLLLQYKSEYQFRYQRYFILVAVLSFVNALLGALHGGFDGLPYWLVPALSNTCSVGAHLVLACGIHRHLQLQFKRQWLLLFWIAFEMVFEKRTQRREERAEKVAATPEVEDVSVFPMAIPMLAGPGAIAAIMLLMNEAQGIEQNLIVLGALVAVILITMSALIAAGPIMRLFGDKVEAAITRVLGVLLAALAAQYVIDGLRGSFFG